MITGLAALGVVLIVQAWPERRSGEAPAVLEPIEVDAPAEVAGDPPAPPEPAPERAVEAPPPEPAQPQVVARPRETLGAKVVDRRTGEVLGTTLLVRSFPVGDHDIELVAPGGEQTRYRLTVRRDGPTRYVWNIADDRVEAHL